MRRMALVITVLFAMPTMLACDFQRPGGVARVGETVTLGDGGGVYARVTVTEVRKQPPEVMGGGPQAVAAAEQFHEGPVALYAVHARIEPTRDLPNYPGTGGWTMMCRGSGTAIGTDIHGAEPPLGGWYLPATLEGFKAGRTYEGWAMIVARSDVPVVLGFTPDVANDPPSEHPDGSRAWPPPASWAINEPEGQSIPHWAASPGQCQW